jgi:uncharacterized membrane protein YccC
MQGSASYADSRLSRAGPPRYVAPMRCAPQHARPEKVARKRPSDRERRFSATNWIPWIFAAKTTASGLIALLVAFTVNLDQPYWALLTVFIVSQPQQSGSVLAKSLYRIIGTVIGATAALVFVALFAQERVLFLGALALWIGLCAFGSQYARNFAAYSFVLSGYTVAIVGIPGALDAGDAFYIATGRITEVCLGIIVAATINRIVLPDTLGSQLWQAVADARQTLADYAVTLLERGDTAPLRAKLLVQANAIENLRASAIFEDREIRDRSSIFRRIDAGLIDVLAAGWSLRGVLAALEGTSETEEPVAVDAIAEAKSAILSWRTGATHAGSLNEGLVRARARLPLIGRLLHCSRLPDGETIRRMTVIARLREFFTLLTTFAEACDAAGPAWKPQRRTAFAHSSDPAAALWIGLRAALAVVVVSGFWILADWPHGSTAAILAAIATTRLATMAPAVPIAAAATLIFVISTIPAFIIIDVLLPLAQGFTMFSIVVAPMLFLCAFLMGHKKTMLIGYFSALLFASTGTFQDRMVYDPVDLINTSIAAAIAAATALVLWAILAPQTPEAARRRFVRVMRAALRKVAAPRLRIRPVGLETAMTEALDQFRGYLREDRPDDVAAFDDGVALVSTGRELLRVREARPLSAASGLARKIARLLGAARPQTIDAARRTAEEAVERCLAELRDGAADVRQARAAMHNLVAFAGVKDEIGRGAGLLTGERIERVSANAA